jgi:hypothetical protein
MNVRFRQIVLSASAWSLYRGSGDDGACGVLAGRDGGIQGGLGRIAGQRRRCPAPSKNQ